MTEKEYIELDKPITVTDTRGTEHETTVRHIFEMNKGKYEVADVRPVVRGEWIPDYDYTEYDIDGSTLLPEPRKFQDGWQCSLCGEYAPSETNYCPNCGADMREES